MTRHSTLTMCGIIGLLAICIEPCAADPMGNIPPSPYQQPLAAIGYNLDSPTPVAEISVSAADIGEMFSAWRNAQRPAAGQVYAIVKQAPTGWMLSSLSPDRPGASGLQGERIVSAGGVFKTPGIYSSAGLSSPGGDQSHAPVEISLTGF